MPPKRKLPADFDPISNREKIAIKEEKTRARARKAREKKLQKEAEEVALRAKIKEWEREGVVPPLAPVTARLGPTPPEMVQRLEASREIQRERRETQLALVREADEWRSAHQAGGDQEAIRISPTKSPLRRRDQEECRIRIRGPERGLRLEWDDDENDVAEEGGAISLGSDRDSSPGQDISQESSSIEPAEFPPPENFGPQAINRGWDVRGRIQDVVENQTCHKRRSVI